VGGVVAIIGLCVVAAIIVGAVLGGPTLIAMFAISWQLSIASPLIALFTIVSIAASISAMVLAGPRVYFAMARDGLFAAPAAPRHPRLHAAVWADVPQCACGGLLWRSRVRRSHCAPLGAHLGGVSRAQEQGAEVPALAANRWVSRQERGAVFMLLGSTWAVSCS